MKGIVRTRYSIATYFKPEIAEKVDSYTLQTIGRKALQEVFKMQEIDIINVPTEKVNAYLEDAIRKVLFVEKEIHEKWIQFPRRLKSWLHYWINVKMLELLKDAPAKEKEEHGKTWTLVFYLFGKTAELYKQGLLNGKTVLSVLEELYEKQDEIKPLRKKEYMEIERKLGGSVKVLINFKDREALRDWYVSLPVELKRGVWVATYEKLLDKLQNLWYNILHQNQ
jgi:hypothetical protein